MTSLVRSATVLLYVSRTEPKRARDHVERFNHPVAIVVDAVESPPGPFVDARHAFMYQAAHHVALRGEHAPQDDGVSAERLHQPDNLWISRHRPRLEFEYLGFHGVDEL